MLFFEPHRGGIWIESPATLLAAALVMSNQFVAKERLRALWEGIKMLDTLEVAREEGVKEGKDLGMLEAAHEMVMDALIEKFAVAPAHISRATSDPSREP